MLNNYIRSNDEIVGAWISVQFYDPTTEAAKVNLLRLFAIKPRRPAVPEAEPKLYVDFHPDIAGKPPAFAKDIKQILDGNSVDAFKQNNDVTKLVREVAGNAIPRDLQIVSSAIPMLNLPNYWLKDIKVK